MTNVRGQQLLQPIEMVVSLRQDQRCAAVSDGVDHVVCDRAIARRVIDQFLIEGLELQPLVGVRRSSGLERCCPYEDDVFERACAGLRSRVDPVDTRDERLILIVTPGQVPVDDLVRDRKEATMRADGTLDARLLADAAYPLGRARGRVARRSSGSRIGADRRPRVPGRAT